MWDRSSPETWSEKAVDYGGESAQILSRGIHPFRNAQFPALLQIEGTVFRKTPAHPQDLDRPAGLSQQHGDGIPVTAVVAAAAEDRRRIRDLSLLQDAAGRLQHQFPAGNPRPDRGRITVPHCLYRQDLFHTPEIPKNKQKR